MRLKSINNRLNNKDINKSSNKQGSEKKPNIFQIFKKYTYKINYGILLARLTVKDFMAVVSKSRNMTKKK